MHILALVVGVLIAIILIIRVHQHKKQASPYFFPALLATFPAYYWVFAIYQGDYQALLNEFLVGLVFILLALVAFYLSSVKGLFLLGIGFIAHGVYDASHHMIWHQSVAPMWWPEFCGVIDIMLGAYVLWLAKCTYKKTKIHQAVP